MVDFNDFKEKNRDCVFCPYSELGFEACLFCYVFLRFSLGGDSDV